MPVLALLRMRHQPCTHRGPFGRSVGRRTGPMPKLGGENSQPTRSLRAKGPGRRQGLLELPGRGGGASCRLGRASRVLGLSDAMPEMTICLDCGSMVAPPPSGPSLCDRCRERRPRPARRATGDRRTNLTTIARRKASQRFYSTAAWRRVRDAVRNRDGECLMCGSTASLTVDHVVPIARAPDLALDPDNLRTLCRRCHGRVDGPRSHEMLPSIG